MTIFAFVTLCAGGKAIYECYFKRHQCNDDYYHSQHINRNICFYNAEDGQGYIYNVCTGKKLLKHVAWVAKPTGKDSLICFSDVKKRGYFSKNTGKVVIEPKDDFNKLYVFLYIAPAYHFRSKDKKYKYTALKILFSIKTYEYLVTQQ